jgi:hypothetical protein
MGFIPDALQAFVKGEVGKKFYPLSVVPHIRKVEALISRVFHPRKSAFKELRYPIGRRAAIGGAEIEIGAIPFGIDINNVVESGICWWGFDMLRFQYGLNQGIGLVLDLDLDAFGHFMPGLPRNTGSPHLSDHRTKPLYEESSTATISGAQTKNRSPLLYISP